MSEMTLTIIDPRHIDYAWKDGAHQLAEATKLVSEITGDQLKLILSRGERTLVKLVNGDNTGWAVFRIDQLPNLRVFFITDLFAPHCDFSEFIDKVKLLAESFGCSRIRCAAGESQERLYKSKLGFERIYAILEKEV